MTGQVARGRESVPLIVFVSASGGVGKSVLSLGLGCVCAHAGLETCLLESDLQFGDWRLWLGLLCDRKNDPLPCGLEYHALTDHLDIYCAPLFPEVAEQASERVVSSLDELIGGHELVIADTGQYWSGLTGELVSRADLVVVVFDPRSAATAGTARVQELLGRMGVAQSRCVYVFNRYNSRLKTRAHTLQTLFETESLVCVEDGKSKVEQYFSQGRIGPLFEDCAAFRRGIERIAGACLPRLGLLYAPTSAAQPSARGRRS